MIGNREYFPAFRRTLGLKPRVELAACRNRRYDAAACNEKCLGGKSVKKIEAIIKPFKLDEVKEALQEVGLQGITVTGGQRFWPAEGPCRTVSRCGIHRRLPAQGQNRDRDRRRSGGEGHRRHPPRCPNGRIGDGKIFVSNIEEAIRIRTGESGLDAI
jgi:nitrogen regulatory protein P-II 1